MEFHEKDSGKMTGETSRKEVGDGKFIKRTTLCHFWVEILSVLEYNVSRMKMYRQGVR